MALWGQGPSTDPGLSARRPGGAEPGLGLRMLPGALWSRWVFLVISVAPIAMVTQHRAGRLWFCSGPAACAAPVAPTHQAQSRDGAPGPAGLGLTAQPSPCCSNASRWACQMRARNVQMHQDRLQVGWVLKFLFKTPSTSIYLTLGCVKKCRDSHRFPSDAVLIVGPSGPEGRTHSGRRRGARSPCGWVGWGSGVGTSASPM